MRVGLRLLAGAPILWAIIPYTTYAHRQTIWTVRLEREGELLQSKRVTRQTTRFDLLLLLLDTPVVPMVIGANGLDMHMQDMPDVDISFVRRSLASRHSCSYHIH